MTARTNNRRSTSLAALLVLGVPLLAGPAIAAGNDVTYRAALTGSSEVPATTGAGTGEITATSILPPSASAGRDDTAVSPARSRPPISMVRPRPVRMPACWFR